MIHYLEGNIFDSPAQVIVNTVNTVGVMGKGIALAFKQRYPKMFQTYRKACENHALTIGKLMLFYEADHWILLFPTKENWRNPSQISYIEQGLQKFTEVYAEKNIHSIAFPKLGCGNGALPWEVVRPLMEQYLKPLPIDVYIYLGINPEEKPEHENPQKTLEWLKENAKDLSFCGIQDNIQLETQLLPHPLHTPEGFYEVRDTGNLFFTNSERTIEISEDEFFGIWDRIRKQGVFSQKGTSLEERLVYALLLDLGYLTKIRILDAGRMEQGYQVNEAVGRV